MRTLENKEFLESAELNHRKSETINKNAQIISELYKQSKKDLEHIVEIQNKTIEYQRKTIKSQEKTIIVLALPLLWKVTQEIIKFFS